MPRPWRGGGRGRGRGGGGRGFSSAGHHSASAASSSTSAGAKGLVSGNFRRLNMKGKRYLRAPNTSAASVKRRRWAHKVERRMIERSEHGYGMDETADPETNGLPPDADAEKDPSTLQEGQAGPQENIDPDSTEAKPKKAKVAKTPVATPSRPKLPKPTVEVLNDSLGGRPSALTALAGFASPAAPSSQESTSSPSACSQKSGFSFLGGVLPAEFRPSSSVLLSPGSKTSALDCLLSPGSKTSTLDCLLSTCTERKSVAEASSSLESPCSPGGGAERQPSPSPPPSMPLTNRPSCPSRPLPTSASPAKAPLQPCDFPADSSEEERDPSQSPPGSHSCQKKPASCQKKPARSSKSYAFPSDDGGEGDPVPSPPQSPPRKKRAIRSSKSSRASKSYAFPSDDSGEGDPVSSPPQSPPCKRRATRSSKSSSAVSSRASKSYDFSSDDSEEEVYAPPSPPPRKKRPNPPSKSKSSAAPRKPAKSKSSSAAPSKPSKSKSSPATALEPAEISLPADCPADDDVPEMATQSLAATCGPILTTENYQDVEDFVGLALHEMGYSEFRPGQCEAVMRVLAGRSTLVVSATGSGKSLCYQLPSLMYWRERQSITLVVSPLVSLMIDQVRNLPSVIPGGCLHTNMTPTEKSEVWDDLRSRKLAVLFVSPEALVGRGSIFLYNMMPPVSFACIDEAHCLSQWSHNFRPSYLQISKVLQERFDCSCILGLTATATEKTAEVVARHIGVPDLAEGIVGKFQLPSNLRLSVSCVDRRDQALLELLKSEPLEACDSIIVYCTRRQTTENVAEMLRAMLSRGPRELPTVSGRKRRRRDDLPESLDVEAYHAGMASAHRARVQRAFISGQLRIVVATVAFGMGLDKPDIRAIVHFDMPSSLESYVQEMGRAGRDGKVAFCHVFLDQNGSDFKELRRHVFSNSVERFTVKQLLERVFPKACDCPHVLEEARDAARASRKERAALLEKKSKEPPSSPGKGREFTNLPDVIEKGATSPEHSKEIEKDAVEQTPGEELQGDMARGTATEPDQSAPAASQQQQQDELLKESHACGEDSPPAEEITACKSDASDSPESGALEHASDDEVCHSDSAMATEEPEVRRTRCFGHNVELKMEPLVFDLDTTEEAVATLLAYLHLYDDGIDTGRKNRRWWLQLLPNRTENDEKFFCFRTPGDLSDDDRDNAAAMLLAASGNHQHAHLFRLCAIQDSLSRSVLPHHFACKRGMDSDDAKVRVPLAKKELLLRNAISAYFEDRLVSDSVAGDVDVPSDDIAGVVHQDVKRLLRMHEDVPWTARAITRLFQGINSPQFPSDVWYRSRNVWRRHADLDYRFICSVAREELLRFR